MTRGLSTADDAEYLLDPFREGTHFTLYRGKERGSQNPVFGVTVAVGQPSQQSLDRLEHEYSLATELDARWAVRPITFCRHQGQAVLILEDPGGEPLDLIIEQHQGHPINLTRYLRIAIGLAAALGQAHRLGIIHKDIKPANALVDCSGHVWLTGFGIASRLPREHQPPEAPEIIAGTLAYMAPEQTGRMNRSIDSRSDLYSLGVTLYEMSTGRLPFAASDPMEWVHCQIARQPTPPRERAPHIPEPVSAIIMKLLRKTAEERFQTAVGLERDLRRCLEEWEIHGRIDEFPLGEYDTPDRLLIPEKLYGRESEINALLAAFDRVVVGGRPEFVLVSGYSGVGKSSLVNEVQKALVPGRGLFASGKFDQYMRDIPYATLAQAFQSLVRQILSRGHAELRDWREALAKALSANGQLIVDLIPELELVIGRQPPVSDLSPQAAQRRFQAVLRRFIGVFARPKHPLALFLDDLQWVDAATLDILEDMLAQGDIGHLLLIGAYRNNEVDAAHPLLRKLDVLRGAGATVQDIVLTPLAGGDLAQLVGGALRCEQDRVRPLIQLVQEKTGGNPFFVIQFLHTLVGGGLLAFDHTDTQWSWDLRGIHAKAYSDNVVDLMVANLNRLPADTSAALCQLACVGAGAKVGLLATACQILPERLHETLWEAVRAGLVQCSEDTYAFRHDRIQEAAYSLIPYDRRAEAHLRIGRLLLAHTPPKELDGLIFPIVSQFNRSLALVISPDERTQVANLNLIAGKRAKNTAAYTTALTYFAEGRTLLTEDCWTGQYSLTFEIELRRAECEFLTGELARAEERLTMLVSRAANIVDQAAATCLLVDLFIIQARPKRAVDVGLSFLLNVGFDLSPNPTDGEVRLAYERIWQRLGSRQIEDLIELPLMEGADRRATIDVLNKLVVSALYQNPKLHQLLIAHMVNFSMEHGNSAASCVGYVSLGRILATEFGDYSAALRFGQLSLGLVDKRGLDAFGARVYFSFGTGISSGAQHLRIGLTYLLKALEEAVKIGDLPYIGYCHSNIVGNLISSGGRLSDVDQSATEGLEFAHKTGSRIAAAYILGQLRLIRSLRGLPCDFISLDGEEFDGGVFELALSAGSHPELTADLYWSRRMQSFVFEGDYTSAVEAAARSQKLLTTPMPMPNIEGAEYHFYAALARAGSVGAVGSAQTELGREHIEALRTHLRKLQIWAGNCPENVETRAALVGAELARLEGHELEADRLYAKAVQSARANGFINIEALAYETAARSYAARGFEDIAQMYLVKARDAYKTWGADGKVRQLETRHAWLAVGVHVGSRSTPSPDQQLDVATVAKASQALSGEMLLPRLIERLLRISVEHAGAERGVLVLVDEGEPWISAEASTAPEGIEVAARHAAVTPSDLPQSVLHYAMRTQERVLLDDASSDSVYSEDEYVRLKRSRSVLCLPIVKQTKLVGALYLENNLTPGAFTPGRVAILDLLASQAAISMENASLYSDLQRSEAFLAQGQMVSHAGSFGWSTVSGEFCWSEELRNILEYDLDVQASMELAVDRMHPDDRDRVRRRLEDARREGKDFDSEHRFVMPDGRIKYIHATGRAVTTGSLNFVGSVRDVTEHVLAEQTLRKAQSELAHVARVATLNAMTASIAHEVSQPLSGILTNANTGARLLAADPPKLADVAETIRRTIRDANRAAEVIRHLRAMFSKQAPSMEIVDLNDLARDVIALSSNELQRSGALLKTDFADDLPSVRADRVQMQQVILNLLLNASDAMVDVDDRPREILLQTGLHDDGNVRLDVQDSGIGLDPKAIEKLFEAFYTTKAKGMGIGLSICRSIIESHDGRLWAGADDRQGATFSFCIPAASNDSIASFNMTRPDFGRAPPE